MIASLDWINYSLGWLPLFAGTVLLFFSSCFAVDALVGGALSPGRRAIAQWIPIAVTALGATFCKPSDIALAVIFSTSVASLSLVLGSIAMAEPQEAPEAWRRLWPFILPAALLALLAGFAGKLNYIHAGVFLIEGLVLYNAWRESSEFEVREYAKSITRQSDSATSNLEAVSYDRGGQIARIPVEDRAFAAKKVHSLNLILTIALAIVGTVAVMYGLLKLNHTIAFVSSGLIVIVIVGPILALPMLFIGANLARRGQSWVATTTGVGVVLLNLCLLLPVVVLLWYPLSNLYFDRTRGLSPWVVGLLRKIHLSAVSFDRIGGLLPHLRKTEDVIPFVYPIITWRVDTVVLVLLGFVLLPVSLGRWRLGRAEGMVLIALYAIYILMETAAGLHN